MKRHIPGLRVEARHQEDLLEGAFLVRVNSVNYHWHAQQPLFSVRFAVLEPNELRSHSISGRLYCTAKALWRLHWFLRDFAYDLDLLGREEVDEKSLLGLQGVIRTVRKTFARRSFLDLESFAPSGEWQAVSAGPRTRVSSEMEGDSDDLQLHTD